MTNGQRGIQMLGEIIEAAVAQGQTPGVVAAVARGGHPRPGRGRVLTQRAAGQSGLPAVGEEVLSWARSS